MALVVSRPAHVMMTSRVIRVSIFHITPGTAAAGKDVVILERSRWRVGSHMEME